MYQNPPALHCHFTFFPSFTLVNLIIPHPLLVLEVEPGAGQKLICTSGSPGSKPRTRTRPTPALAPQSQSGKPSGPWHPELALHQPWSRRGRTSRPRAGLFTRQAQARGLAPLPPEVEPGLVVTGPLPAPGPCPARFPPRLTGSPRFDLRNHELARGSSGFSVTEPLGASM